MHIHAEITKQRPGHLPLQAALDVNLKRGRIHILSGPPGSGKGTLLRILEGRQRPDRGLLTADGRIWFKGDDTGFLESMERPVEAVFGDDALSRHQTPRAVLSRALAHWPTQSRARRVARLLEYAGLVRSAHARILELSLDQRWMLSVARALAPRPKLLLLENPFAFLPPGAEPGLRAWIHEEEVPLLLSDDTPLSIGKRGDLVIRLEAGRVQDIRYLRPAVVA